MNRAEGRIRSYQNSISQLNPMKDSSVGNSEILANKKNIKVRLLDFKSYKESYRDRFKIKLRR